MLVGLIADIHGNIHALKAVLAELNKAGVALTLCAGDLLCYGANNNEVLDTIRQDSIPCVAGNYDYAVAWNLARASRKPSSSRNEPLKQATLDWTKATVASAHLPYLRGLPITSLLQLGDRRIQLLHAGLRYLDEWITPEEPEQLAEIAAALPADFIILGHSHLPFTHEIAGTRFINPGSLGRPLDGNPQASYALLDTDTGHVVHRRLAYDLEAAVAAILESDMPDEIAALIRHAARRIDHI